MKNITYIAPKINPVYNKAPCVRLDHVGDGLLPL